MLGAVNNKRVDRGKSHQMDSFATVIRGSVAVLLIAILCTMAFFLGWGLRSCGGPGPGWTVLTYPLVGPLVWFKYALPAALGAFVLGGVVRPRLTPPQAVLSVAIALVVSLLLGLALLPGGCSVDI